METRYSVRHNVALAGMSAVSLTDAKEYVKQDLDADDTTIANIVREVVSLAEKVTNRQMNTAENITSVFEIEEANSDGNYVLNLIWDDSTINKGDVTITAINQDGNAEVIDDDDWQLRNNQVCFTKSFLSGYQLTISYNATALEADLAQYKQGILEVVAGKYYNRDVSMQNSIINSMSEFISSKDWM